MKNVFYKSERTERFCQLESKFASRLLTQKKIKINEMLSLSKIEKKFLKKL